MGDGRDGPVGGAHADDDSGFEELVELFVSELPERVRAIEAAAAEADSELVQRLAHQLKGSAGGYGFWNIGDAATRVESALRRAAWEANPVACAAQEVRELIELCRSVREPGEPERASEPECEERPR